MALCIDPDHCMLRQPGMIDFSQFLLSTLPPRITCMQ